MKNVFVPAGDRGVGSEILEQLRIFGMTVHSVGSAEDIARLARSLGDGLLVADCERLDREPAFVRELALLKEELGPALRLVFYADRDNFATRLKAVRAGGEAFFQLPVDAALLADRIDTHFKEREAPPYRVLIVDDDPEQAEYNALILQRAGMVTSVATEPSAAIPLLVEARPEIILMDMYMPSCTGPELAALVRQSEAFATIPIIFLSVERDIEKQISAIRRGGDDFLEKPIKPEHLVASVAMRAERTRSLRYFMERDSLTGLLNHTNLNEHLVTEILRAKRSGAELSFGMIDLDGFKAVNEGFGHLTGDRVLRSFSRLLSERLRRTDIVGRYGGEQFGIILPGADGRRSARLVDELRDGFSRLRNRVEAREFAVTFSCGIATYPDYVGPVELIEAADRALRRAKGEGRDRVLIEKPQA